MTIGGIVFNTAALHYGTEGNDVDSSIINDVTNLLSRGLTLLRKICNDKYALALYTRNFGTWLIICLRIISELYFI